MKDEGTKMHINMKGTFEIICSVSNNLAFYIVTMDMATFTWIYKWDEGKKGERDW